MRVGLLGGTFDPIHVGHTYVARAVQRLFALDRVLFVVALRPPHKKQQALTSPDDRFSMVGLATRDDPTLIACDWELRRPSPTYTIELLDSFRRREPAFSSQCFIAGSDSLKDLHTWREYARLLKEHSFVFVQRPGDSVELSELKIPPALRRRIHTIGPQDKPAPAPGRSYLIRLAAPDIRSKSLRLQLARDERPGPDAIDSSVLDYINTKCLYDGYQEST